MSAWVVTHKHINSMVHYLQTSRQYLRSVYIGARRLDAFTDEDEIGRILLAENIRSVAYRYQDSNIDNLPGTIGETLENYRYTRTNCQTLTPVEALKAVACWRYQSCETEDYKDTDAWKIAAHIENIAIGSLPGYDEAPWGID